MQSVLGRFRQGFRDGFHARENARPGQQDGGQRPADRTRSRRRGIARQRSGVVESEGADAGVELSGAVFQHRGGQLGGARPGAQAGEGVAPRFAEYQRDPGEELTGNGLGARFHQKRDVSDVRARSGPGERCCPAARIALCHPRGFRATARCRPEAGAPKSLLGGHHDREDDVHQDAGKGGRAHARQHV